MSHVKSTILIYYGESSISVNNLTNWNNFTPIVAAAHLVNGSLYGYLKRVAVMNRVGFSRKRPMGFRHHWR